MKVGTNEFLLKRKTIAFYFNFDREENKKKKKSLFTFHVFRRLKKKINYYKYNKTYYYSPHHSRRR